MHKSFKASGLLLVGLLAALWGRGLGISDEYEGFIHFHEADVTTDEVLWDASDIKLPGEVWSAVCESLDR
jgi:hypothetical protein